VAGVLAYQTALRLRALDQPLETLLLAGNLLLAGAALAVCPRLWPRRAPAFRVALVALALAAAVPAARALAERWHGGFARAYYWLPGGELSRADPGETRVCVVGYRYYPFFGSRRQSRACRPLWLPVERQLLEYLARQDATLVVVLHAEVAREPLRFGDVSAWLRRRADVFEPVRDEGRYLVCRVERASLERALASRDVRAAGSFDQEQGGDDGQPGGDGREAAQGDLGRGAVEAPEQHEQQRAGQQERPGGARPVGRQQGVLPRVLDQEQAGRQPQDAEDRRPPGELSPEEEL
jgi:hypothetical protein